MLKLIEESQIESKTVISWSSQKEKMHFLYRLFCLKELLYFISIYSVLNTLSEHNTFTYQKTLLHTLLFLVFKIVKSV